MGWVDKNRSTDNNSIGQVDILFKIEQRDADIEHGISIIILTAVEFVREISTLVVAVTDEMCWDATTVLTSEVVRRTSCVCYTHTHMDCTVEPTDCFISDESSYGQRVRCEMNKCEDMMDMPTLQRGQLASGELVCLVVSGGATGRALWGG